MTAWILPKEMNEQGVTFSDSGKYEMNVLKSAGKELLNLTVGGFTEDSIEKAFRVQPLVELVGNLCDDLRSRHITRLRTGKCKLEYGFAFNNLLSIFENMASHCSNVSTAILEMEYSSSYMKEYNRSVRENRNEDYNRFYTEYETRFTLQFEERDLKAAKKKNDEELEAKASKTDKKKERNFCENYNLLWTFLPIYSIMIWTTCVRRKHREGKEGIAELCYGFADRHQHDGSYFFMRGDRALAYPPYTQGVGFSDSDFYRSGSGFSKPLYGHKVLLCKGYEGGA